MDHIARQPASMTPATAAFIDGAAHIDGEVVPIAEARIPITDTGFLRSDVTYDVIAVTKGRFFRLADHLDRFERSCRELRLKPGLDRQEIITILHDLVSTSGLREAYVEVICTRGQAEKGLRDPRLFTNRFYAFAIPYVWLLHPREADTGMDAVITRTVQRISSAAVDPTVKNFHWGDLTRGLYEAYDRGARYPILLDSKDNVTEGPGYNIFAVIDEAIHTPDAGVLLGVTRRTILELAQEHRIPSRVAPLPAEKLHEATELFATSTAGGVMPITSLDGEPIGDARPGPLTRKLRELYWAAHRDPRHTSHVHYQADAEGAAGLPAADLAETG